MTNQGNAAAIQVLNDLVETCKDGEYGFRICAEQAAAPQLKELLQRRAADCATAATQLQDQVFALGGTPEHSGSVGGALHRGWVSLKTALSSQDDLGVLQEAERGEDVALRSYRDALAAQLPAPMQALVEQQYAGVQKNHRLVRDQRDALEQRQ